MTLIRGIVVDAADGRAYVVWGVTGTVAHLMPIGIAPGARSVRIEMPDRDGRRVSLYVNTRDRRHLPAADLARIGALAKNVIADLVADVSDQRAAAHRARHGLRRAVMVAARAARMRRATA